MGSNPPGISIVIPARNEESQLPACLAAIERAREGVQIPVEVIVVINRCTDRTEEVAKGAGAVIVSEDAKNLARIRNSGARASHFAFLVTIDADSRMSKNMLMNISAELSKKEVVGGGVMILPERWSLGIILSGLCLSPLILFEGIAGGLFFCRKKDFDAIGGFNEKLVTVEDVDFARRLKSYGKAKGMKFKSLWSSYIVTSCRKWDKLGDWFFLRHPILFYQVFKGTDQALADRLWYDFER